MFDNVKKYSFGTCQVNILIILLLTVGFFLRIYNLGARSLWLDESISSIAAISLMEKGTPILPSGLVYDREILNTFLIASSFKIFGINEFAARLPSVMFGTLTILLAYLIGSKWWNKRIGIIAALLVAFSVWEIAWSRQARMYQQLQFFYILSLYLFYEFMRDKSLKNLAFLALSFTGTLMNHAFGYVLIPVFLAYLIFLALKNRSNIRNVNRQAAALGTFVLVFCIMLGLAYHKGIIQSVLRTDVNNLDIYINILKNELGIFLFIGVAGGIILVIKDRKKGTLFTAGLILPLYFIFFHVLPVGTRYLYFVVPVLLILVAYFLDFMLQKGNQRIPGTAANIIVFLLLVLAMYFSPAFTFNLKERYDLGVNAPQLNFRDAYLYVKDNMGQDDVIISAWTPPAQFYVGKSDYWLAFNVIGTGEESFLMKNSTREIYTNATAISDVGALKRIIDENPVGWVIVDGAVLHKLKPAMRDFIRNNLTFYKASGKIDMVEVYGWS